MTGIPTITGTLRPKSSLRNQTHEKFKLVCLFLLGLVVGRILGYYLPEPSVPESGVHSGLGEHLIEVEYHGNNTPDTVKLDGHVVIRAHTAPIDYPELGLKIWIRD